MLNIVLTFLIVVPSAFLCLFPMKNQLKVPLSHTLIRMGILFAAAIPTVSYLAFRFSLAPNTLLFPMVMVFYIIYHLSLRVHISKSLSVFVSVLSLLSIFSSFSSYFDAYRHPELGADSYTLDFALLHLSFGFAAMLLLAFPLQKYGSRIIDQLDILSVWYCTIPFTGLILAVNMLMRPVKYETYHINNVGTAVLLIFSLFLVLWVMMHVIFYFIVTAILNASKMKEEIHILEMQKNQFLAQQRYLEETSRARHDFRQSIRVLHGLAERGDIGAISSYLDQYVDSLPTKDVRTFCNDQALNAVLNHYWHFAQLKSIRLHISIDLPEQLQMQDFELCGMIGNLLENAINASLRLSEKERFISLSTLVKNNSQFVIVVTNTYHAPSSSRKRIYHMIDPEKTGTGLTSITSTAKKYGGITRFSQDEKMFYSNILIPLK